MPVTVRSTLLPMQTISFTEEERAAKVRRYTTWVTLTIIIVCNGIFVLGIWVSGVDLESMITLPDEFNPEKDACLRYATRRIEGSAEPIRLCSEWINFSDPARTHTFHPNTKVIQDAEGALYFDHGPQVDYRLLLYVGFAIGLLVCGMIVNRYLIARYRARLEASVL